MARATLHLDRAAVLWYTSTMQQPLLAPVYAVVNVMSLR